MIHRFFVVLIAGIVICGCTTANTHRYDLTDASFAIESDKAFAVCTVDRRSYVVSGEKPGSFVGIVRGGFGAPLDINTGSDHDLARDMTGSIVRAFSAKGIRASAVNVSVKSSEAEARAVLLQETADRFVLTLVREWKTDTFVNTGLTYDLTVSVMQKDGTPIANKTIRGKDDLGSSFVPADARVHAETAFRKKLEALFNSPEVMSGLK